MGEEVVEKKRAAWGNQIEFILTLIGFAVGLGNVWRFPYLCFRNGGGAFLVPYFTCLVLMGIPLFFMELCFGQFASLGPLKIWIINPACKGIGFCVTLITACIVVYYNIVVSYCIYYFFASMTSSLPWTNCDEDWNTCLCRDSTLNANDTDALWGRKPECENVTLLPNETVSPSEEYFIRKVLKRSSGLEEGGTVLWDLTLCNLLAWTIIFLVLTKGIKSLGKVMYFAAIFPYILLTVLLVRGLTLDGHMDGINFYIQPNVTKLTEAAVWSDAAVQIFYSLGICQGGLIAMASFNTFKTNSLRDAFLIPIVNCGTSFYAGFVIFSVLGFMANNKHTSVGNVVADGPGLVFMVYPEALAQMPVAPLWSILFFLMMTMLGFSSQFSATETILSSILDEIPYLRRHKWRTLGFRAVCCLLFFLLGLPMTTNGGFYLFNLIDNYTGGFPLLFAGVFEIIAIIYLYGFIRFKKDIEMMLGTPLPLRISFFYFAPMWCLITPLCLLGVIVFKAMQYEPLMLKEYDYPDFGDGIGWAAAAAPVVIVVGWYIVYYCMNGGSEVWTDVNSPKTSWGPALEENRGGRYKREATYEDVTSHPVESNGTKIPMDNLGYEQDPVVTVTEADVKF